MTSNDPHNEKVKIEMLVQSAYHHFWLLNDEDQVVKIFEDLADIGSDESAAAIMDLVRKMPESLRSVHYDADHYARMFENYLNRLPHRVIESLELLCEQNLKFRKLYWAGHRYLEMFKEMGDPAASLPPLLKLMQVLKQKELGRGEESTPSRSSYDKIIKRLREYDKAEIRALVVEFEKQLRSDIDSIDKDIKEEMTSGGDGYSHWCIKLEAMNQVLLVVKSLHPQ